MQSTHVESAHHLCVCFPPELCFVLQGLTFLMPHPPLFSSFLLSVANRWQWEKTVKQVEVDIQGASLFFSLLDSSFLSPSLIFPALN